MKIILFFGAVLMTNLAMAQIPIDGLVGHWSFNGNANDESGNGYNGILEGVSLTADRLGNTNSAYEFDGVNDYIDISSSLNGLSLTNVGTWSVWVKPFDATPLENKYFLNFGDSDKDEFILIGITTNGNARFLVRDSGTNQFMLETNSDAFSDNNWTHIVVAQNGTEPIIYVNDVPVSQIFTIQSNKGTFFSSLTGIDNGHIGMLKKNGEIYGKFQGAIDDVRIYNRVLTKDEISSLYNESINPSFINIWRQKEGNIYYNGEGNVGIGTDKPLAKLTVNGSILSTEIKVNVDVSTYPDFVFKSTYKLRTLAEVEQYINENGHLPEIPKAIDVQEGLNLGEMNTKLLQKIEELTIYAIEQNKEIMELKKQNERLKELEEKIMKLELTLE